MRRRGGWSLAWSVGFPLAGGVVATWFVHWSQQYWWTGPAMIAGLILVLLMLWHW